jgi:dTDP-4-dehydrorhamnose reductase
MRIYLTGADGMVGAALQAAIAADPDTRDWQVHAVSVTDFDIGDASAVRSSILRFRPDVVVHLAACAVVDDCEADPALAMRVNVAGVHNVAAACRAAGARVVYLSSDYVFDGQAPPAGGYREEDLPNPVSVYGMTKLAGERIVAALPDALTVRTSWLYGGDREQTDTVLALLRRAAAGDRMPLVADQTSGPTYTADLAAALLWLLRRPVPVTGTLHAANSGAASWWEVGRLALSLVDPVLAAAASPVPTPLDDFRYRGRRPMHSALNVDRIARLGHPMPHWRDALQRYCAAARLAGMST